MISTVLTISEAASLGLHASVLLAADPTRRRSVRDMAGVLRVSEAHLAKVMRRLTRAGVVRSARGPGGGFALATDPSAVSLLQVYEVLEGPLCPQDCLFDSPVCPRPETSCLLEGLLGSVGAQVRSYLSATTLSDVAGVFQVDGEPGAPQEAEA